MSKINPIESRNHTIGKMDHIWNRGITLIIAGAKALESFVKLVYVGKIR